MFCILLILLLFGQSHLSGANGEARDIPMVDALIFRIRGAEWAAEDVSCLRATLGMLYGVKNNTLMAVWVWDSMQTPTGSLYGSWTSLGNYDQCLGAPWDSGAHPGLRSQYCLVGVKVPARQLTRQFGPFDDAREYYQTPTKDQRFFNEHYIGMCLPSVCSTSAVKKITQNFLDLTHVPGTVHLDPQDCTAAGENLQYSTGFYVFWTIIVLLVAATIYSTVSRKQSKETSLGIIRKSFCAKRNYNSLFTVGEDSINVLNGMKSISAAVAVLVHEVFYQIGYPNINGLDVNKLLSSTKILLVIHSDVIVDTFFAISGLLLARRLFQNKQQRNLLQSLVIRYFRLIGPFALTILYIATTVKYMGQGPLWHKMNRYDIEACRTHWIKTMLMANTDVETLCHVTSWSNACDYQLAVFGTFIVYLYRKNRKLGMIALVASTIYSMAHMGWNVYTMQLNIVPFDYRSVQDIRTATHLNYNYMKSHVRGATYFVGMFTGYILATYKPSLYRNVINKRRSIAITTAAVLSMFLVIGVGAIFKERQYDALEAAVVSATNRVVWAAAVCAIICVCEYGTLPIVPSLLGWPGFVPLCKLSYCVYIFHPLLLQFRKFNARTPCLFHPYELVISAAGVLVVSCLLSLVMYLILEAPLINIISNMFYAERNTKAYQNGHTKKYIYNGNGDTTTFCNEQQQLDDRKTKIL